MQNSRSLKEAFDLLNEHNDYKRQELQVYQKRELRTVPLKSHKTLSTVT